MTGSYFSPLTESAFWRVVEHTHPEWLGSSGVSVVLSYYITDWTEAGASVIRVVFETEEAEDCYEGSSTYKNRFLCLMNFDFEGGGGWYIADNEIQIEV